MSEDIQEEKVIQILKDRGIIESDFDFTPYIFVIKEDKDYYEVVIDGTLEIKKNIEINKTKKPKRIRITEMELLFCSKDNEIIQFDIKCTECKHFNGHYSATGYIGCNY